MKHRVEEDVEQWNIRRNLVRETLGITPVERGDWPKFLIRAVHAYCDRHQLTETSRGKKWYPLTFPKLCDRIEKQIGIQITANWMDHWGVAKGGRYGCCQEAGECFVAEPYNFETDTALLLDAVCKELKLTWHVGSDTWWNPGATIRITLHEKVPDDWMRKK